MPSSNMNRYECAIITKQVGILDLEIGPHGRMELEDVADQIVPLVVEICLMSGANDI